MGVLEDCQRVVKESLKALGGLDIIISNAVSLPFDLQIVCSSKAGLSTSRFRGD